MAYSFGIYYGGSSMNIAYCKDDQCSIIVNESGYRSTPSMFAINGNEFSVGLPVKQNIIRNSSNTISFAKHFIADPVEPSKNQQLLDRLECEVNHRHRHTIILSFFSKFLNIKGENSKQ
jgi:molecular chaperone DnaK (HSP70)